MKRLARGLEELGSDLLKQQPVENSQLQRDKIYLYYLQNGKDMYTGEEIDLNNLRNYQREHIIPQSFLKDDSWDNLVLTIYDENGKKEDKLPSQEVVTRMRPFWDNLKKAGLISERKYKYLTKIHLTDDDKKGFIKRQLVETRQITKHVARLLDERFNPTVGEDGKRQRTVAILTLKSSLTSQFRKMFDLYKVREINDYHHAHDAYLNAVVGKALLIKYPQLAPEFVYGEYAKTYRPKSSTPATEKVKFYSNVMKFFQYDEPQANTDGEPAWINEKHIAIVKKVLSYPQVNVVKKTEVQSGRFTKETALPKGDSDKLIPRKTKELYLDPKKYGGVDSPTVAYSVLVVASVEKGKAKKLKPVKEFVGITIMERQRFESNPIAFLEAKGYHNIQANHLIKLPKYSLFEMENGRRRLLASSDELQKGNEIVLPQHLVTLLSHAQKMDGREAESHVDYLTNHKKEFVELFEIVIAYAQKVISKPKAIETLVNVFEQKKDSLDVKELALSFVELMKLTAFGAPAEFKFLGKTVPRQRYKTITECLSATLIHQSVTGLYETRIDLSKLGDD